MDALVDPEPGDGAEASEGMAALAFGISIAGLEDRGGPAAASLSYLIIDLEK